MTDDSESLPDAAYESADGSADEASSAKPARVNPPSVDDHQSIDDRQSAASEDAAANREPDPENADDDSAASLKGRASNDNPSKIDAEVGKTLREVAFRHSKEFVPILEHLGGSLLISTYSAGKVVAVGVDEGQLTLEFANFSKAMGLAVGSDRLAVCTREGVCILRDAGSLAAKMDPAGKIDRAFLTRSIIHTGNVAGHEMAFREPDLQPSGAGGQGSDQVGGLSSGAEPSGDAAELWMVNTLFSCLCTVTPRFSFTPCWKPSFISRLAPEDRCHLNGMAWQDGPVALTALGTTDSARGWRDHKADGGVVIDFGSGEVMCRGLCMPHSPRVHPDHPGRLFVLDSGTGRLLSVDRRDGAINEIAGYPGYGRGLAITRQFAFVGMSRARETSVFGGVPICQQPDAMRCGVVVVDLTTGRSVAFLEFEAGVDELFDVQWLPNCRRLTMRGPMDKTDGHDPVWVIPPGFGSSDRDA